MPSKKKSEKDKKLKKDEDKKNKSSSKKSKTEKKALKPKASISKGSSKKTSSSKKDDKSQSTTPKVKVTSGTIARAAKTRIDNFAHLIYKRAKDLLPGVEVSKRCVYTTATMLDQVVQNLVDQTLDVYSTQGRKTINVNDAFVSVQAVLPQILSNASTVTAARVIAKRHGNEAALEKVMETVHSASFPTHY